MITMAIDGSSRRNGKPDCIATGAVYIETEAGEKTHILGHLENATNQRGELLALLQALEAAHTFYVMQDEEDVYLITDSEYVFNAVTKEWYKSWARKGWVTAEGTPVKNRDLWIQIKDRMHILEESCVEVSIYHIKGHLISVGKVTARKTIEADATGELIHKLVESKYEEHKIKKADKYEKAHATFVKNHGFELDEEIFRKFVIMNSVADLLASNYADKVDASSASR